MSGDPLILYIPGLLPKPKAATHRDALLRCLLAGVRRIDGDVARTIEAKDHRFDIVSWTYNFYGVHRNFAIDANAVDAVIAQQQPTQQDIDEASSWRRRLARRIFLLGDLLPLLIPHIANERLELHLRDLRRYARNRNGIAEHVRQMLKTLLRAAAEARRPVLLLAHSMGSVIAYDALWQMSHSDGDKLRIDLLLTMGSPLGQRYIQRRLQGHRESGSRRYPGNIRRWINLTAVGDLTAIDPVLSDDFAAMIDLGLVDGIDDRELHNYFRLAGKLNVHAEYGYLVNAETAKIVTEWWQSVTNKM